jgi:hypothetical protein
MEPFRRLAVILVYQRSQVMADKDRIKHDSAQAKARNKDPRSAADLRQSDFASDIQGRNKLQGNDQEAVRNQRREQPQVGGATGRPTGGSGPEERKHK